MAFLHINFYSGVLGRPMQASVSLPEIPPPDNGHPTLFLLHDMGDDHSAWTRFTSIDRYASEHHLAIVMPEAKQSWYTNTACGERYFDFISDELPCIMQRILPSLSRRRENTWVAGAGVGGYGALKCGLERSDVFSKIAVLAGALDGFDLSQPSSKLALDKERRTDIFGRPEQFEDGQNDLFQAAQLCKSNRPQIRIWCGSEDALYDMNLRMGKHLQALGYALTFCKGSGGHDWQALDREIQSVLNWLTDKEEANAWH